MNTIKNIDISNSTILLRVDFNVPIENGNITSTFRLDQSLPTIKYCLENNANIILISHLGRPKGKDEKLSLYPIFKYLENIFPDKVFFSNDCISDEAIAKSKLLKEKQIHLLENLRFYSEELDNSKTFAKVLSKHADIYINDAFGTSHREHASNSAILSFFKCKGIGLLMEKELTYLSKLELNKNKLTILLGGAKVSTKLSMIKYFLDKADYILIGGGMAFTFLKALGFNIGKSLYENTMYKEALNIIELSKNSKTQLIFPEDFLCSTSLECDDFNYREANTLNNSDMGFDISDKTIKSFSDIIEKSNCLIWNGPLGVFEKEKYSRGTRKIAEKIVSLTEDNLLISVVGGGDTASAVIDFNLEKYFSHVSTGGGASLKLLSGETLQLFKSWESNEKR